VGVNVEVYASVRLDSSGQREYTVLYCTALLSAEMSRL
jgi:hypothetical protein